MELVVREEKEPDDPNMELVINVERVKSSNRMELTDKDEKEP